VFGGHEFLKASPSVDVHGIDDQVQALFRGQQGIDALIDDILGLVLYVVQPLVKHLQGVLPVFPISWPEHVVVHTFDKIIQHAVYLPH